MLARLNGEPVYIVHLTCIEALKAVREARARGQIVYAETCPQYLLLDDSVYDKPDFEGAAYVMSPPIRPKGHQDALWAGLKVGLIQVVATDHCPFNQAGQKEMGKDNFTKIPNGAAGIENRLGLLYTAGVAEGRIDLHELVNLFATQPAKIFGLYPRKGSIVLGGDADIVVYDPMGSGIISAKTHRHRCDRNIFEGFAVKGAATHVIVNGRVQMKDGKLDVQRGAGRYLPRKLPAELKAGSIPAVTCQNMASSTTQRSMP
jgi:dihydropyrimidinase